MREWKEILTKGDMVFYVKAHCHQLLASQVWCP